MSAFLRALFPPIDLSRLRFRGGWSGLPIFAILSLVYPLSLQQANWVDLSDHFTNVALVAIVAGTLIGNSALRPLRATALSAALGALTVVLLTIFAIDEGTFRERAVALGVDVNTWLTQVLAGEAARGQSVFTLLLGASTWAASYTGAYALARSRRVWEAIVVNGACLTVNVSLALTPLLLDLVVFSLCALVLMVRLHIVTLTERWEARNIQPTGEMDWRVLRGGLTWTTVLVIMALVTPRVGAAEALGTAFDAFEAPYQRVEAEWQRFFAGVSGPSRLKGVSFNEAIRLGQSPNLGESTVVHVDAPQGRFWRLIAYDFYTGQGWRSTEIDRTDDVSAEQTKLREAFEATFEVVEPLGNRLFAPNEPIAATVPVQFLVGQDRSFSSGVRAVESRHAAGTYTILSVVSVADKGSLRRATGEIPESIRRAYLQIPSTLPQRVRDLAREVVVGRDNAYDRAETIESFLRTNYRYAPVVRPPPPGRDPVDFFLFDLKEDFCEYFASSMVMMLREVGIPARLVEGFTSGTFDPTIGKYVVKQINAHAWVEAWFPGYGWIEFEPTPSETPFLRPELPEPAEAPGSDGTRGSGPGTDSDFDIARIAELEAQFAEASGALSGGTTDSAAPPVDPTPAVGLLGLLLVAMLAFVARFELRFRRQSPIEAAWGKTRLLAAYVGHPSRSSETTYEFADALTRVVPEARQPIRTIADARVREHYAPDGADDALREAAEDAWWKIAKELLVLVPQRVLAWIVKLLPR